jgi:hypothetical protein
MLKRTETFKQQSYWKPLFRNFLAALCAISFLIAPIFLTGCKTGSSGDSTGASGWGGSGRSGDLIIGLTDAPSDFVTYTVDVVSLTLTKQNGTVVNTLPLETRVDFSLYTDMTEFLTAATVPSGIYTKAVMTLDYQNADIQVENMNGVAVPVENILDDDGNSITTLKVSVHLEGINKLLIVPGIPVHLTLDFDLKASNQVEFDNNDIPTVTIKPLLLAEVNPKVSKIHRLRGPLKDVNVSDRTFDVIIRPFIHVLSGGDQRFGILNVVTDNGTIFEINGELYQGEEGLQTLDSLPILTAIIVIGDLSGHPRRFEARHVYAGSSVPGGDRDVVTGNVISRQANTLTVKGATLIRAQGSVIFNDNVLIQLGLNTTVRRQLSFDEFNINEISVGQRVMIFGELNANETQLDASQGYACMLLTTLRGEVVGNHSRLQIDLEAIDGRHIGQFDFSGTGSDWVNDADPANYEINNGAINISTMVPGTAIKVRGFVTAFGHAPEIADFDARTIINVSDTTAVMVVDWFPASPIALEDLSPDSFTLNLTGNGWFHHLCRAGVVTDLTNLANPPLIKPKPNESGQGLYFIVEDGRRQLLFTFEDFVDELSEHLNENADVRHIVAVGKFDNTASAMTVDWMTVSLK